MAEPARVRFGPISLDNAALLWGLGGAALLGEYLLVSLRFDAQTIARRGGPWEWMGSIGAVAPLGVAVATALLLFRSEEKASLAGLDSMPRSRRLFRLVVHVVLYGLFLAVTARVFGDAAAPSGSPAAWFALWGVLGASSALALFAALVGVRAIVKRVLSSWVLVAVLVGVAAWIGGQMASVLWQPLSYATLQTTAALLRLAGQDVYVDPATMLLALPDFAVTVAPVCSGLEGMGLITVLLIAMLVAMRKQFRFPHALLIVPIGVLCVWVGNSVRLAGLMVVGEYLSPEIAHGGFHSKAGWVLFCAITLALASIARHTRLFSAPKLGPEEQWENPVAAFLVPMMVVTATALLTGMFTSRVDPLYGVRVVLAAAALFFYRRHYTHLRWHVGVFPLAVGAVVGVAWVLTGTRAEAVPDVAVSKGWIALRVVGSVLIAAVCEELAFRGYLLRRLIASDFTTVSFKTWTPLAIVASSLAFGALHERWLAASLAGMVYAIVQLRSGENVDAMVAHAATNAVIAVSAVATGNWSAWS